MEKAPHHSRLLGPLAVLNAAAFLLTPPNLAAYTRHLSEDDVREAYFFGQRHDLRVAKFFDAYEKQFTSPSKPRAGEAYVRAIGVRTPYSSAVLHSYQAGNTYTSAQAWKDYKARESVFEVVVWVTFGATNSAQTNLADYSGLIRQMFPVRFESQDRALAQQRTDLQLEYFGGGDSSILSGAEMHFEYVVQEVASGHARIEVTGPEGMKTIAEFDLADLR